MFIGRYTRQWQEVQVVRTFAVRELSYAYKREIPRAGWLVWPKAQRGVLRGSAKRVWGDHSNELHHAKEECPAYVTRSVAYKQHSRVLSMAKWSYCLGNCNKGMGKVCKQMCHQVLME